MSKENTEECRSIWGRAVSFETSGEKCEVHLFALQDGDVLWEFVRADRALPIRLSKEAFEAMFALSHELLWDAPKVPSDSANEGQKP